MNAIQDFCLRVAPQAKMSPNGWYTCNCPACIHNGEPSADTKHRMGLKLEGESVRYHCFRCSYTTSWVPGQSISVKLKKLWGYLGATYEDISKINFEALKLRKQVVADLKKEAKVDKLTEVGLPTNTKTIFQLAEENCQDPLFIRAIEYINSRNPELINWFDNWSWSPDMAEHIIIPLMYHKQCFGYTARLTRPTKNANEPKYYLTNSSKFMLGAEHLEDEFRKKIILVEGPFDAIAISGIAIMGNKITDKQMQYLRTTDKEIIIFPDRDDGGQKLIDCALENDWAVSLPDLNGLPIKDAFDLCNYFGRLFAIKLIIDNAHTNHVKIKMLRKNWK